jgi:hypothetical protein
VVLKIGPTDVPRPRERGDWPQPIRENFRLRITDEPSDAEILYYNFGLSSVQISDGTIEPESEGKHRTRIELVDDN